MDPSNKPPKARSKQGKPHEIWVARSCL